MTLEQLQNLFHDATSENWHQHKNGGGWIENSVNVSEDVRVGEKSIIFKIGQAIQYARLCGQHMLCSETLGNWFNG